MTINYMTGRAMGQGMGRMMIQNLGSEIMYSFIIIACSLIIYFSTKELYELSGHKGTRYFRISFLFFAIAYGFRSLIKFLLYYSNAVRVLDIYPRALYLGAGRLTLFVFMYFSSMAIFYLLYSVMYKKWDGKSNLIYIFQILALTIATISIILTNPIIYLGLNLILLFLIITALNASKKIKKTKNNLHVIYTLLSVFWAINIIEILIPNLFQGLQLIIYMASSGIFLAMLYRVTRKLGSN